MGIITLTTDLGQKDFYLATLYGCLYSKLPNIHIVSISHTISPFNIAQGAFIFKNAFLYFPKNTIHIIGINCDYNQNPKFIGMSYKNQFILGPDNGIFSLIIENEPEKLVQIETFHEKSDHHFPLKDILIEAACKLSIEGELEKIGSVSFNWTRKMNLLPVFSPGFIRGTVIYIDDYQNVITNITKSYFLEKIGDRKFEIRFKRRETLDKISYHYGEVPEGEKLCLFGISGHLEIAINKGKAAGLLGLKIDDIIQIDYKE